MDPQATGGPARPSDDEISARAYALWQQRGRPDGQQETIWFDAERELAAALTRNDRRPEVDASGAMIGERRGPTRATSADPDA